MKNVGVASGRSQSGTTALQVFQGSGVNRHGRHAGLVRSPRVGSKSPRAPPGLVCRPPRVRPKSSLSRTRVLWLARGRPKSCARLAAGFGGSVSGILGSWANHHDDPRYPRIRGKSPGPPAMTGPGKGRACSENNSTPAVMVLAMAIRPASAAPAPAGHSRPAMSRRVERLGVPSEHGSSCYPQEGLCHVHQRGSQSRLAIVSWDDKAGDNVTSGRRQHQHRPASQPAWPMTT